MEGLIMTFKRKLLLSSLAVFAIFVFVAAINAQDEAKPPAAGAAASGAKASGGGEGAPLPPAEMEMKNTKMFEKHRMGIVTFHHEKHSAPKPDGYGLNCGECHHDAKGKPLTGLKPGEPVKKCADCHSKPGKPKRERGISPEEWKSMQLKYYYGAIHENCVGCHKKMKGPVKCTECHPKPEKK